MLCGLDGLLEAEGSALLRRMRGGSLGVLTHAAAVDRRGHPSLSVLEDLGVTPEVVMSPEHGLDGQAQAMVPIESPLHAAPSSTRRVSLYGSKKESLTPSAGDLSGLELLVIDLCDVGSRYYTYVWTALLAARAAARAGVHTAILDRPNPISGDPETLEGRPQEAGFCSFVGLEPLPIRHAMTIGELVARFIEADGNALGPEGALSVVPMRGWERLNTARSWLRPFVMPSPNMPTLETAMVYPGGCLVEGTNLSEGRGTTSPFQIVGAPFLDGEGLARALDDRGIPGAQARPVSFRPAFDKYAGEVCNGVMLHVTNPGLFRPVASYLALIALARRQAPSLFEFRREPYEFESEIPAFDLLTGSGAARQAIEDGAGIEELIALVAPVPSELHARVYEAEECVRRAQA